MDYRILGPLEVRVEETYLSLGPKPRALLGVLLLHPNEVVSAGRLADELWGERQPATAGKLVQLYVSQLRKALGDAIVTRPPGYLIRVETDELDSTRFQRLLAEARLAAEAGPAEAGPLYAAALALWRGPALADVACQSFARNEAEALDAMRLTVLEEHLDVQLALGRTRELVPELEALVAAEPLRERPRAQLMLALYRSGRRADALELYRETRRLMVEELGIEPGEELRALERGMLRDDPALAGPTNGVRAKERAAPASDSSLPPAAPRPSARAALAAAVVVVLVVGGAAVLAAVHWSGGRLEVESNSVAVIDPSSNRVVGDIPVGARPATLAVAEGVWVANLDDGIVSRIDPRTRRVARMIPIGPGLSAIAGHGRALWATSTSRASGLMVRRVDPRYDEIVQTIRGPGSPWPGDPGLVAVGDGAAWVASRTTLSRLDARAGRMKETIDPGNGPSSIAVGYGAVWAADFEANNLVRIDAATGVRTDTIPVGRGPAGLAVGAGSVWLADGLDGTVRRIDPETDAVTAVIHVGRSPAGLAVGAGAVWVANSGSGTVSRIDPTTNHVARTIEVSGSPQFLAVADGKIWVSVQAPAARAAASLAGTLRVESRFDVDSLDPALGYTTNSWLLEDATCAKLLNYPDERPPLGSRLVPEVAAALPVQSQDGKSFTFTIRKGFRFSPPSNEVVTAQTFKSTIERTLAPRMRSPARSFLGDLVGLGPYEAGNAGHVSGIVAHGDKLTIRLTDVAPDLLARIAMPFFCAVPKDTPVDPRGVRLVSSAGPYYVATYNPGHEIVLARNPNYRGGRPQLSARIAVRVGVSPAQQARDVEVGTADYAYDVPAEAVAALSSSYGPGSAAAKAGRQRLFVSRALEVNYLAMNTSRPLFADARLRRAVNYAIDRRVLAASGYSSISTAAMPTDDYLPPGLGLPATHAYPITPDIPKARRLAQGRHATAMLYACNRASCRRLAEIVVANLRAIGIHVAIRTGSSDWLYSHIGRAGEPYDLAVAGWGADYPDPADFLNQTLSTSALRTDAGNNNNPRFDHSLYNRRLQLAARLAGAARSRAYAKLDSDLVREAAPWAAFSNDAKVDFFSSRTGCQVYRPASSGMDLAALCLQSR